MIKCPNCSAENADGSSFCSTCGKKLEVLVTCPACGGQASRNSSFCPWCGESLKGEQRGMLSNSVVAGDVSVDSSTKIDASTNYNGSVVNIFQQTTAEVTVKCQSCGKPLHRKPGDANKCPVCGEQFCSDCFDFDMKLCVDCADSANRLFFAKRYEDARKYYKQAIANETTEADVYFRSAVCLLKGQKAFVQQPATIGKIMNLMKEALRLEEKAIYYYFLAYIKYDYYKRKYYDVTPDYTACYRTALAKGLKKSEVEELYSLMGVPRPSCL